MFLRIWKRRVPNKHEDTFYKFQNPDHGINIFQTTWNKYMGFSIQLKALEQLFFFIFHSTKPSRLHQPTPASAQPCAAPSWSSSSSSSSSSSAHIHQAALSPSVESANSSFFPECAEPFSKMCLITCASQCVRVACPSGWNECPIIWIHTEIGPDLGNPAFWL